MIPVRTFANADVAVFGLARSGVSSVAALKAGGARILAWDDNQAGREAAEKAGARVIPQEQWPWDRLKALILSPGVPLTHPAPHDVVSCARASGVEVIGDIELFAREIRPDPAKPGRAPVIAVTGTNGKSTTTALIGHILNACGFAAEIGGNIGKPVLDLAQPNGRTIYVLEVSSYQIDLAPGLAPDISVLTNITPDHIDRHGSLENYVRVKARLLEQTDAQGHVVIGVDDAHTSSIHTRLASRGRSETVPVSVGKVLGRGVFAVDGALYDAWGSRASRAMDLSLATRLLGAHNWQNAALAFAATKPFVKDTRSIVQAIASFPGLAHRIEDVGRLGKVRFINDLKATNADAAERALVCFNDIFWIAGGRPKAGGIESLVQHFPRIRKAYLIGEAANEFARTLDGRVTYEIATTLDHAINSAAADARLASATAPIVLLSPACASFDQFRDFEARGDAFRAAVDALASVREGSVLMVSRADKTPFAVWWWTTDRLAFSAMIALVAIGLMLAFAASPAATGSAMTAGDFRFAAKQIAFAGVALIILMFTSALSLKAVKISAAVVYALALIGSALVLFSSGEVLGARRWIEFGGMTLQPSEFLKPGFAVLGAAILADKAKMVLPKELITFLLLMPALVVLILQNDVGQTGLLFALWGALLFFNGASLAATGALAGATAGLGVLAYFFESHVRHRVDQYLSHDKTHGGYQTGLALKAFAHGGWTGVGPGAGTVKYHIPDAHSDFIFAVAGEEYGLVLCGAIAVLFCVLTVRLLLRSARGRDAFSSLCGAALATVVALQAFINMGVATSLLPAKGMTLPFISYGGSSLFAVALTMGYALSVTRQRSKIGEREHEMFRFLKEAQA